MFFKKGGYETSQKGATRDVYQSIVGLRDFVFQLIRSADFREAIGEFFQYLQILAGEVNIDEKGSGNIISKLASGIKSMGVSDESKTEPVHETTSEVVSSVSGATLNLQHKQEESLLPSKVHSEEELKRNQGQLSEPGEFSRMQQQQEYGQQFGQSGMVGQQWQQPSSSFASGSGMGSVGNVPSQEKYSGFGVTDPNLSQQRMGQQSNIPQIPQQSMVGQPSYQQPEFSQQQPLSSGYSGIGSSQQQPLSSGISQELKPTSLYGTSHQGISPLQSTGQVGHFSDKNIVDDQYREPSLQSNVQAQQFRPVSEQQQFGQQQWQPSDVSQQGFQSGISQPYQSNIPQVPQQSMVGQQQQPTIKSGLSNISGSQSTQEEPVSHDKNRREIEDSLIDRYVQLNKRFSKDPNYQRALYGLFNLFNQVKSLFGDTATQGGEKTKTVERLREDDDFKSLLNYAKLILYEFSNKEMFDKWLDTTNAFFIHLRTDERMKGVLRDIMNDFRRYGNQPTLLESHQEKEQLRQRLWQCRTVLEEKKNMDLTNDMLTYGRELLTSMRNDELNTEIRDRSQKLISRLFLDEQGKFQLKPSALEQIRTILFVAIQEAINNWNAIEVEGDDGSQYFKISNITLKANDILPDDVKFKVKNRTSMKYEELKPTDRLAESATLIGAHLFGMTAHLKDVGFLFDRRSFPSISDRGLMDIDFDRGGINIKLKLKARLSQNRPFYVKGIGVGVDTLHIKFKQAEKHKIMLKMLSPIIQSRVRRKIHDNLETALNTNIRELIERLNDLIEQTIIQGNVMAGQGEQGGMLTGIIGRMGINTAGTTEGQIGDWPQEGGEYSRSSSSVLHSTPTSTTHVPVSTTTKPVQKTVIGSAERRTVID